MEDPGEGNRPIGALAMVTAAVCHLELTAEIVLT